MFPTRPKLSNDEDELFRLEKEFLEQKQKPSASVINKRKAEVEPRNSKGEGDSHKKTKSHIKASGTAAPQTAPMLSDIREITSWPQKETVQRTEYEIKTGFPEVLARDPSIQPITHGGQKKSIFAQQMKKLQRQEIEQRPSTRTQVVSRECLGHTSVLVDGSSLLGKADAQRIHEENVQKLSSMSKSEILAERAKYLQDLDPQIIKFLKNRKKEVMSVPTDTEMVSSEPSESETKMETEPLNKDELPINLTEARQWPHMDNIEADKLKWMTNLPPVKPISTDTGHSARFDFEGDLLAYDADIPVTKALHHHGEEPERAGYTVDELFQLIRSSNLQQRVIALQTVANILRKTKEGFYDKCFNEDFIKVLLDAGLLLMLRYSLDDSTESVMAAACQALYCLLVSGPDEICLDHVYDWHCGHEQPSFPAKDAEVEDESEMKDHELVYLDVIRAVIRIDTLPRLRYILEVVKPSAKVVLAIMGVLTRISRHSLESATLVANCPQLMTTIMSNFLPETWTSLLSAVPLIQMTSVYNIPLHHAVKLLRVMAAQGREIASQLVYKYHIMKILLRYITIDPFDANIPTQEVFLLIIESHHFWRTVLSYGLTCNIYVDVHHIFMKQMIYYENGLSVRFNESGNKFNYDLGAAFLNVIHAALDNVGSKSKRKVSFRFDMPSEPVEEVFHITWEHISDLLIPLEKCTTKWLYEIQNTDNAGYSALKLVAAALDLLSTYYLKFHDVPEFPAVDWLPRIEQLWRQTETLLKSRQFTLLADRLRTHSQLLCSHSSGTQRDPCNLPSLGSVTFGDDIVPIVHRDSPFHFMMSLCNFLSVIGTLHKGIGVDVANTMLNNSSTVTYIGRLGKNKIHLSDNWFTKYELLFLRYLLKLALIEKPQEFRLYHSAALLYISQVHMGDEFFIFDAMELVFSSQFLVPDLLSDLDALRLTDAAAVLSPTKAVTEESRIQLLQYAVNRLPYLCTTYRSCLGSVVPKGKCIPRSLTSKHYGQVKLPVDWPFLPLMQLYNNEFTPDKKFSASISQEEKLATVSDCLQWVYILECLQPECLQLSRMARFCRLVCVFLAGNDFFLDDKIHKFVEAILKQLLKHGTELNFNEAVPGLSSFYDFYSQLVEQFEGVSYGDNLFGNIILLPLQRKHDTRLKMMVWGEHSATLRIQMPVEQLLVPLSTFLEPEETDENLLLVYFKCLITGSINEVHNPVLYTVAFHHVSKYLQRGVSTPNWQKMKNSLSDIRDEKLKMMLLEN